MISFKSHTREDISSRISWLNNRVANLYALDDPNHIYTLEEQNKWFDNYEKDLEEGKKKFFTILNDGHSIGFMGLSHIDQIKKTAEIFILIGNDECRGKGIGKESMRYLINYAFHVLNLNSLHLEVNKLNTPAINLFQGFGFQKTEEEKEIKMVLRAPIVVKSAV